MCKYAEDLFQLCRQLSSLAVEEGYSHIHEWSHVNKLRINISKTIEIVV